MADPRHDDPFVYTRTKSALLMFKTKKIFDPIHFFLRKRSKMI